jgi:hypothetical protein
MSTGMAAVSRTSAGTMPCCRSESVALATTGLKEMLPSLARRAFFMPKNRQFVVALSFGAVNCVKNHSMAHHGR